MYKTKKMKSYTEYKEMQTKQDAIVDELSDRLNSYPKGEMGLTPDHIKNSEEFKTLNASFKREFNKLREINGLGTRLFKKEIRQANEEKRKLIRKPHTNV